MAFVRRQGERGGVKAGFDFGLGDPRPEIDHRHGPFACDVTDRIDAHAGPAPRRSREAARIRPSAAPVADVGFPPNQHHVVWSNAHIP